MLAKPRSGTPRSVRRRSALASLDGNSASSRHSCKTKHGATPCQQQQQQAQQQRGQRQLQQDQQQQECLQQQLKQLQEENAQLEEQFRAHRERATTSAVAMLEEHAQAEASLEGELAAVRRQLAAAEAAREKAAHKAACDMAAAETARETLHAAAAAGAAREARLRGCLEQAAADSTKAKERSTEILEQQRSGLVALQQAASRERKLWEAREEVLRNESSAAATALLDLRSQLRSAESEVATGKRKVEASATEAREAWAAAEAAAEADRMGRQALAGAELLIKETTARLRAAQTENAAKSEAQACATKLAQELRSCQQQHQVEAAEAEDRLRLVQEELARERYVVVSMVGAAELQKEAVEEAARRHSTQLQDQRHTFAATLARLESRLSEAKVGLVNERSQMIHNTLRRVVAEQAARHSLSRQRDALQIELQAEHSRAEYATNCLAEERQAALAALEAEKVLVDELCDLRSKMNAKGEQEQEQEHSCRARIRTLR